MSLPFEIKPKIILASASPRRKQIFNELGLKPLIIPVEIDEYNHLGLSPVEYAMDLANKKAAAIAGNHPGKIIVGADTIVVYNNKILEKPKNKEDAYKMLTALSGRNHEVISGVNIKIGNQQITFNENTKVYFKELSSTEINWYLDSGEPFDKAGSYGIQGLGRILISKIEGCYFNVVGFPIHRFYIELKALMEKWENGKI
ncbi:MAG: septum formation protein Maf [Calditrichia bacterium]|nr:septum formation protein Maf [Calditrichia bacterium]